MRMENAQLLNKITRSGSLTLFVQNNRAGKHSHASDWIVHVSSILDFRLNFHPNENARPIVARLDVQPVQGTIYGVQWPQANMVGWQITVQRA